MNEKFVLSILATIMFLFALKRKDKRTITITTGLLVSILITWIGIPLITTFGLFTFSLIALYLSLTKLLKPDSNKLLKFSFVFIGVWSFISKIFVLMHWPFQTEVYLSSIIPIALYFLLISRGLFKRKEFTYMTILSFDFLLKLIKNF